MLLADSIKIQETARIKIIKVSGTKGFEINEKYKVVLKKYKFFLY